MEIILNEQMFKWIYSFRMSRRLSWQVLDGLGRTLLVRLGRCCATRGGWCEVHRCCAASRIAASLEQSSVYWLVQELAYCA